MLDVHPPHQSVDSWTDFFIHIASIVVGLVVLDADRQFKRYS
jgi:hypothetical protein